MDRQNVQVLGFSHLDVGPEGYVRRPRIEYDISRVVEVTTGMQYVATQQYYPNTVWWYMVSRAFLIDLGIQFEVGRLVEDAIFTANVICAASRFAFLPIDIYRYVHRPGSTMRTRTTASTKKMVADYERVVFGLEELRQRLLTSDTAPAGLLNRLVNRQQSFVFFLIGRLLRSDIPPRPILLEALERLRAIDMYPFKGFTGRDYTGMRYTFLTFVFNREYLLYPFIRIYRSVRGLRR